MEAKTAGTIPAGNNMATADGLHFELMNAREAIAQFLDQWLRLTERESQAIQAGDWTALTAVQAAKAALQRPLSMALERWDNTNSNGAEQHPGQPFFRPMVDRLIALEARNLESLAAQKVAVQERKDLIEQASRNLRMVRDSYARKPAMAWQAYS